MMSINLYRLRHQAQQPKSTTAKRLLELVERPDRLLGVILIGNTFANIFATSLATYITIHYFGGEYIVLATVLLTIVILLCAEIMPKTIAAVYSERIAYLMCWPLSILLWLSHPFVWILNTLVNQFLKLFNLSIAKRNIEGLDADELQTVVNHSERHFGASHRQVMFTCFGRQGCGC